MKRAMNFGPGPSCLPLSVLEEAQREFLDFAGTGMSILEVSHRSPEYDKVHQETQSLLKELLGLGVEHHVLFYGGGATTQFTLVPMNLLTPGSTGNYLVTGSWAQKAAKEAKKIGAVHIAATTEVDEKFSRIPQESECHYSDNAAYVHLTSNNTIFGTQWHTFPNVKVPLVADMSSDLLWRPFDAQRFGLIYAGAQKNLGPAGLTVVIVHRDLLAHSRKELPSMFSYAVQAENQSLLNTPPCFAIYIMHKTLQWVKSQGGLVEMERRNRQKAGYIYDMIDKHPDFYRGPVEKGSRSTMNVVFTLPNAALEKQFVSESEKQNIVGIKGHRSVGGMRVSLYNAVPLEWAKAMSDFMQQFITKNG